MKVENKPVEILRDLLHNSNKLGITEIRSIADAIRLLVEKDNESMKIPTECCRSNNYSTNIIEADLSSEIGE